jgi:site-specific DNA-methyltransferase (adenine-specific)
MPENYLYYGDNLHVLRDHIKDESVDLIYLDPPFNSNRSYNVLFKDESGQGGDAQIAVFDDSWHWGDSAEATYNELVTKVPGNIPTFISALRQFIGNNQMMAYLVMMAIRLIEMYRVLKQTGSLYLHCDPTASHYLKILLDMIFDVQNFRNEITWKRRTGSTSSVHQGNRFGTITDSLLFYSKSTKAEFFPQYNFNADGYQDYIDKFFKYTDEKGRRYQIDNLANPASRPNLIYEYKGYKPPKNGWAISKEKMEQWDKEGRLYFPPNPKGRIRRKRFLDELQGKPVQNLWDDIEMISSQSNERLGYQTQKPLALLERIIQASSRPGDLVLDPFSGCGTCIAAAQKLGRRWIGIDVTHLAIAMHKARLKDMFGLEPKKDYQVIGEPADLAGAHQLAHDDRYQFQWWALSLVEAKPVSGDKEGKKGSDKGIDGVINFIDDASKKVKRVIIQVKSGHVNSGMIRDLKGVLEREQAQIGVFITLESPTRDMETEAVSSGYYKSNLWQKEYPRIQIYTIEQLIAGSEIKMPLNQPAYKKAEKQQQIGPEQGELDI